MKGSSVLDISKGMTCLWKRCVNFFSKKAGLNLNIQKTKVMASGPISSVQSLSLVQLFATPWTVACQASLSITNSWSLPKLMSIESVMPSSHLILCHPLLLPPSIIPSIRVFPMSKFFASGGQGIGVSASASVLPVIFNTDFL